MTTVSGYTRMMDHSGISPVTYFWEYAEIAEKGEKQKIIQFPTPLNEYLGKNISLKTNDEIRCMECGKKTKKSFNQGYCFVCFSTLAKNDLCIMKPETCHFHKGTCREPNWGEKNCFKGHTVYFANSSGLKVGITKENPISNRWVDQGASFGVGLLEVQSRRDAGILESYLAKFLPDKTTWQKMVSMDPIPMDLNKEKEKFLKHLDSKEFPYEENPKLNLNWKRMDESIVTAIQYPILSYPKKIKSLKLTKDTPIEDKLVGIKGQYLLFENGVINVRSLGGLWVEITL